MKILEGFGRLLLTASKKLKRLANGLGTQDTEKDCLKEETTQSDEPILVWGILEGPIGREEFPEGTLEEEGVSENFNYMMVLKVSSGESVGTCVYWFETFDEAYEVKKYFDKNIEPMELRYWLKIFS